MHRFVEEKKNYMFGVTFSYVDDISMQLDTMQSDINSLKGLLLQNEGLTVDVNTLLGVSC